MNKTSLLGLSGVFVAAAFLSQGCRTLQSRDGKPAAEPVAEPAPAPAAEAPAGVSQSAELVGQPGSYPEFIIPEKGADHPFAIESDGLTGSTGTHVSPPAPVPDPAPAVKPAPEGSGFYVVQSGDILGRIARKHGVTTKAIMEANNLADANKIRVGQKLRIPAKTAETARRDAGSAPAAPATVGRKLAPKAGYTIYTVQNGDILGRVSRKHGTTVKAILEANGLSDANKIRAGQQIYIPAAAAAAPEAQAPAPAAEAPAADPAPDAADDFLSRL